MKLIVLLKKLDLDLARREACVVFDAEPIIEHDDCLVFETTRPNLISRLSQTRSVEEYIFDSPVKTFQHRFSLIEWERFYKGSFAIRSEGLKCCDPKDLAAAVWQQVREPEVDLDNPKTEIVVIERNSMAIAGIHHWTNEDTGRNRTADKRPFMHPTSLNPVLARCMINLTGIDSGLIVDPFCGSGGILIEAGLMGLDVKGSDIDPGMVEGCKKNLEHFGIMERDIEEMDAQLLAEDVEYIVTDLPYGINTKGTKDGMEDLYKDFFSYLSKHLKGRAVIGLPDTADPTPYLQGLGVLFEFTWYIHKSLTKRIIVVGHKEGDTKTLPEL